MELVERGTVATAAERVAVSSVLGDSVLFESVPLESVRLESVPLESLLGEIDLNNTVGGEALRARRNLLLPVLHAVNDAVGWLSIGAIDLIARHLGVSPAEIYGVATFYDLFSTVERSGRQVHVCVDVACRAAGGSTEATLRPDAIASPCLGLCEQAPAALMIEPGLPAQQTVFGRITQRVVDNLVDEVAADGVLPVHDAPWAAVPQLGDASLTLLRRVGRVDPFSLDAFFGDHGFCGLAVAREIGADAVIERLDAAGLTGRGGAGFPTGRKWRAVQEQPVVERHIVCNADESEPGTFKDRVLMENDPFTLIEAMMIAAFATGAQQGWIYLRGEYPRARATLEHAIAECREYGLLGVATESGFDIELRRGAGAYICGEETAVFNSIEGYRGEPRNKPPFPFQEGLFGKPTVVNNVETLYNVPGIVVGRTDASRRLFCVAGAVRKPGVYEAPIGITLRELLALAGGMRSGSELQAIMLGGAAGGFAGPDDLDLALDNDALRAVGLTLGSGVVLVHDQTVDLRDQLGRIARFFRHESCGQCVPCRVGTVRQDEALQRGDTVLLGEIGRAMTDASICGLGQTASSAILSAIERLGVRP